MLIAVMKELITVKHNYSTLATCFNRIWSSSGQ